MHTAKPDRPPTAVKACEALIAQQLRLAKAQQLRSLKELLRAEA